MKMIGVLAAAMGLAALPAIGQEQPPPDIAQWDITCYCAATATPHMAVWADDNGRILYAARQGITAARLRADNIPVLDSQLYLLRDFRLLKKTGDVWQTSFPVLGPSEIGQIRTLLHGQTEALVRQTRGDVNEIVSALQARGMADNAYSVLFSYVLDGLTWDRLYELKALRALNVTADHPFWDGVFWATFPKRSNVPGSNTTSHGKSVIRFTWTDKTIDAEQAMQNSAALGAFLDTAYAGKPPATALTAKDGTAWRLTDESGNYIVPVIDERVDDPIHRAGKRIADAFVDHIRDKNVLAKLKAITGLQDDSDAITVAMHEFIWDSIETYVAQGAVKRPAILGKPDSVSAEELRKATMIILRR